MTIKIIPKFNEIFPDEEKLEIIEYLKKIPKELLLQSIGFCNTYPLPNYNNFFSNPQTKKEVLFRVNQFKKISRSKDEIEIITPYSCLRLAEIILNNIYEFTENGEENADSELCLFKVFLILGERIGNFQHNFVEEPNHESLVDFLLLQSFQLSELSLSKDDKTEFVKLIYSTIYKFQEILSFLEISNLKNVKTKFIESFNVKSESELIYQMKYLFAILFIAKYQNQYIFSKQNFSSFELIQNLTSTKIVEDEDFTEIKKYPIYFLDENRFSVINFFFAVDLFYRSAKFRLKEIYLTEKLDKEFGDFFSFYNKKFSEEFLMKNILDKIFEKRYFTKYKNPQSEQENQLDYYVNYNNTIYLFENKDVLINKSIKATNSIEPLLVFLKQKFYLNKDKKVGIQQLVYSIEQIYNANFKFDDTINYNKKIQIFPILIVQDRVFQSFGINYKLNNWFRQELNNRLIYNSNKFQIKGLILIDIDTLILWKDNVKNKNKLFKTLLENHVQQMETKPKKSYKHIKYLNKYFEDTLKPISLRSTPFFLPKNEFSKQFTDLLKNKD